MKKQLGVRAASRSRGRGCGSSRGGEGRGEAGGPAARALTRAPSENSRFEVGAGLILDHLPTYPFFLSFKIFVSNLGFSLFAFERRSSPLDHA